MGKTNIEWADRVWNPIVGCTIVSPGCTNCYAMRMAARLNRMLPSSHYEGLTQSVNGRPVWTGKVALAPDHIFKAPLYWRKPTRVFVNSMSDLFHEDVPDEWVYDVFAVMISQKRHQFQVLTKRPLRMKNFVSRIYDARSVDEAFPPPSNIWLGVSVEDQARADERIPLLLETPAAVRFISAEPLLGPVDLSHIDISGDAMIEPLRTYSAAELSEMWGENMDYGQNGLDWVIAGGESGPGKRPVDLAWLRSIRDQCRAAGVPVFIKQIDKIIPIPDDLMIREFPQ